MKEGQDPKDLIASTQREYLCHLLDVRADVVMREHYSLRLPCAAARKNHCGEIIQRDLLLLPQGSFEQCNWEQKRQRNCSQFFRYAWLGSNLFDQHNARTNRQFDLRFLKKCL